MPEEKVDSLAVLKNAPLFRGLGEMPLEVVHNSAFRRRLRRGEFFFYQAEPATHFYLLLEGQTRLNQLTLEGHQVTIRYVGPGESLGVIVVLSDMAYPLSAETVTDCLALGWEANTIADLMERYPRLALNGMRMVAGRFRDLQHRYRELATERVERRVARALLRLARQTGRRVEEGVLLDIPLSRQDLGEMTGTTLYTVSRILSGWEQEGLLITGRQQVIVSNPHGLVSIAEDLPD